MFKLVTLGDAWFGTIDKLGFYIAGDFGYGREKLLYD